LHIEVEAVDSTSLAQVKYVMARRLRRRTLIERKKAFTLSVKALDSVQCIRQQELENFYDR